MTSRFTKTMLTLGFLGSLLIAQDRAERENRFRQEVNETRVVEIDGYMKRGDCTGAVKALHAYNDPEYPVFDGMKKEVLKTCTDREYEKAKLFKDAESYHNALDSLLKATAYSSEAKSHNFEPINELMKDVCARGLKKSLKDAERYLNEGIYPRAQELLDEASEFAHYGIIELPNEYFSMRREATQQELMQHEMEGIIQQNSETLSRT